MEILSRTVSINFITISFGVSLNSLVIRFAKIALNEIGKPVPKPTDAGTGGTGNLNRSLTRKRSEMELPKCQMLKI